MAWRTRFLGVAVAAGLLLLVGGLLSPAPPTSRSPPTSCPLHLRTATNAGHALLADSCSGDLHPTTFDPCSTVTAGAISCAITFPDLNPADWVTWLGCEFLAQATAIFNAIVGQIGNFLVQVVNGVLAAFTATTNTVITALENAIQTVVNAIVAAVQWVANLSTTAAQAAGPFAPIVSAIFFGLMIAAGVIGFYFATVFLWATFKTGFNLL